MSIRRVALANFKSYKYQIINVQNGANVFVGKNGHGKSNLFNALKFLFSDIMRKEERQHIMHSGTNQDGNREDMFVEVTLDNKNRKIPLQEESITLKRVWTADDKDEYYLNDKPITQNQLNNVLECAGISRSNPFNIVQQGRINKITNMSEEGVYELLEEITGVRHYLRKEQEAQKILEDIGKEKQAAGEILDEIKKKITELESQKENFQAFTETENRIKCLTWCYYDNHIKEVQQQIDPVNQKINQLSERLAKLKMDQGNMTQQQRDREIQSESVGNQIKNLSERRTMLLQEVAQLAFKIADIQRALEQERSRHELQKRVSPEQLKQDLLAQIEQLKMDQATARPALEVQQRQLHQIKLKYNELQDRHHLVQVKNAAASNFKTGEERVKFITESVNKLEMEIKQKSEKLQEQEKHRLSLEEQVNQELEKQQIARSAAEEHTNKFKKVSESVAEKKHKLLQVREEQMKDLKNSNEVTVQLQECQKRQTDLEKRIDMMCKESLISTVKVLIATCQARKVIGVYGVLIDMLEIPKNLCYAVDVACGVKLFSLVVEDEDSANQVIEINKELKGCSINIYPLKWVRDQKRSDTVYPGSQDILVLHSRVKVRPPQQNMAEDIQKLVIKLLSKYILVKDYDLALHYAKENKLNCITPNREVVYSGGYLTKVGHQNANQSGQTMTATDRITCYNEYKENEKQMARLQQQIQDLKEAKDKLDDEEQTLKRNICFLSNEANKENQESVIHLTIDRQCGLTIAALHNQKQDSSTLIAQISGIIEKYKEELQQLQTQLTTGKGGQVMMVNELSKEDKKFLEIAEKDLEQMREQIQKQVKVCNDAEMRCNSVQGQMAACESQLSQLIHQKSLNHMEQVQMEQKESELRDLQFHKDKLEQSLKDVEKERAKLLKGKEATLNEKELAVCKENQEKMETEIAQLNMKKLQYLERRDDFAQKRGNADIFEREILQEYQNLDLREVIQKLEQLNINFASGGAIAQSGDRRKFTAKDRVLFEKLGELLKKYDEYSAQMHLFADNEEQTQELIKELDRKCRETVDTVFEKFSRYFQEYFTKIVPGGTAELRIKKILKNGNGSQSRRGQTIPVMMMEDEHKTNDDHSGYGEGNGDDEDDQNNITGKRQIVLQHQQSQQSGKNLLNGISIQVHFTQPEEDDQKSQGRMTPWQELSAGQRSVIAIALLFALQRCDPAPFYVFDEIDAALDANYRLRIAEIIQQNSRKAQYLMTSFKQEIVGMQEAKYFEVNYHDKQSTIKEISQKQALEVIQQQSMSGEEQNE